MTETVLYPWELHAHTAPVSVCAKLTARQMVRAVAKKGYYGIVVTDHYNPERFEGKTRGKAFAEEIHHLFGGFREAASAGAEEGVTVLCSSELRITAGKEDYLLYGLTEDIALEVGFLADLPLERVRERLQPHGILIVQAHPCRPGLRTADSRLLDGVEVVNGNPRHQNNNDRAFRFAQAHGLLMTRGSDVHESGDEGCARMLLPPAKDERALVQNLLTYAQERYIVD